MKIGLLLGNLKTAGDLGALAAEIEARGFDSLWAGDHVAFPAPILDPLQTLACYAAHTRRIRLGTCVYLLALRRPAIAAKMVASVDFLSGGRMIFGIGVGGEFPAEFDACGVPVTERGARTNESVDVLRRLWSGRREEHAGRFFRFEGVQLKPPPAQHGGPPIWIGGRSDAALRRTARQGDGYVGYLLTPKGCRQRFDRIRDMAADHGRAEAKIARALMTFTVLDRDRDRATTRAGAALSAMYGQPMETAAARYCILGRPQDCREAAARYAEAGVEHLVLTPILSEDDLAEQIEALAEAFGVRRPAIA